MKLDNVEGWSKLTKDEKDKIYSIIFSSLQNYAKRIFDDIEKFPLPNIKKGTKYIIIPEKEYEKIKGDYL